MGGVFDYEALARSLERAWHSKEPILPLGRSAGVTEVADAYRIQETWTNLKVAGGERILGRKIGLTSKAMRDAAGVYEPDFGALWSSRFVETHAGVAEIPHATFIQPRLEGEIAFLIGKPLTGSDATVESVLAATEALSASFEVADSRIVREQFSLVDTVSDNASYGAFALGPWDAGLVTQDLRTLGMLVTRGDEAVVEGIGYASLGHPANAVAWLANKLAEFDVTLQPGDIVLSGSLGAAIPVQPGDEFALYLHGQAPLVMRFP